MILKDLINQLSMFDENLPVVFEDYDEDIRLNASELTMKIRGSGDKENFVIGFGEEGYDNDYDDEEDYDDYD